MDYRKRFVVEPGAKVRLGKIDPAFKDTHKSQDRATPEIQKHVERMAKLQYLMYADANQSRCCPCWCGSGRVNQDWSGHGNDSFHGSSPLRPIAYPGRPCG